jgi:hypothetical protein
MISKYGFIPTPDRKSDKSEWDQMFSRNYQFLDTYMDNYNVEYQIVSY